MIPHADPAASRPVHPPVFSTWLGWIAAAGFALSTAYFGSHYIAARSESIFLANEAELARVEVQGLSQELEAARILHASHAGRLQHAADPAQLKLVRLDPQRAADTGAAAMIAWNPANQSGLLVAQNLPALPPDETYRLWITEAAQPNPLSASVFEPDAQGSVRIAFHAEQNASHVDAFSITREPKTSSTQPAGPVILSTAP